MFGPSKYLPKSSLVHARRPAYVSISSFPRNARRRLATTSQQVLMEEKPDVEEVSLTPEDEKESEATKAALRHLLRDMAQPVAVVTSFMPGTTTTKAAGSGLLAQQNSADVYHGATLSSFTSIAMDPHPLVAFALRIPSRMASALSSLSEMERTSVNSSRTPPQAHMVVNLLSSAQAAAAVRFSRPDLYPTPFRACKASGTEDIPYTLNREGLPIMDNVIGALSCQLVGRPIPLHDLEYLHGRVTGQNQRVATPQLGEGQVASELFIARVLRVEKVRHSVQEVEGQDQRLLPLVYHRQNYTSCAKKP
ncbi:hypothetical protein CPC08DRAFT_149986 [Agrocybe pediades]|nr:hypothetical protein CPC08DRAFT_149986 [Agrocybe pediades]